MGLLTIDGVDLSTLGIAVTAAPAVMSAAPAAWESVQITQRPGVLLTRAEPQVAPRTLTMQLLIRGTDRADAEDTTQDLKAAWYGREVLVAWDWMVAEGRSYPAYLQAFEVNLFGGGNIGGWVTVDLEWLVPGAYAIDDADSTDNAAPTTPIDIEVGTAPTEARLVLDGPATDPTFTWKDEAGVTLGTMVFDVTLGAADALIIDARDGGSVTLDTGGTLTNGLGLITNAGYTFPIFRPQDADRVTPDWPTVEASTGALLTATYRKRFR